MTQRPPTTTRSPVIRIASVPAAHPYVEHLGVDGVVRLADPQPAGAPAGQWWPPAMVDPAWIGASVDAFDVMHLHFGNESFSPGQLVEVVDALRAAGRPLVYTVHDLANPQLVEQARHVAQLDVLLPAADALVTLTHGAAGEIQRRWGRTAEVIGHPHILPLDAETPLGRPQRAFVAGLHLRDLRPNVDGARATRTLLAAVAELRRTGADAVARVELHDRVRDEAAREEVRRLCAGVPFATLAEAPRPTDTELLASLAALDVSVLPYGHGTHSGWVELCWDLGVAVAAPAVGYFAEQHADADFCAPFTGGDAASLAHALTQLAGRDAAPDEPGRPSPGSAARRSLQRARRAERRIALRQIGARHLALYRRVLSGAVDPGR